MAGLIEPLALPGDERAGSAIAFRSVFDEVQFTPVREGSGDVRLGLFGQHVLNKIDSIPLSMPLFWIFHLSAAASQRSENQKVRDFAHRGRATQDEFGDVLEQERAEDVRRDGVDELRGHVHDKVVRVVF